MRNLGSTPCTTKNGERTTTQRALGMNPVGHEERLPPPRLSGCCRFSESRDFRGAHGNGRDAPEASRHRRRRTPRVTGTAAGRRPPSRCRG
jgi:hypothetical protein